MLSEEEIRLAWRWAETAPMHALTRYIFKLTLVTGQRPGEVCEMQKPDVTIYDRNPIWTIPGERRKNGETHVVPLSDLAIEILEDIERVKQDLDFVNVETYNWRKDKVCHHCGTPPHMRGTRDVRSKGLKYCSMKCRGDRAVALKKQRRKTRFINSPYVFPSPQRNGAIKENALNTVLVRVRVVGGSMTMGRWAPHDLRRTAGTNITGLVKETQEVMDKVLGHKDRSVGAVYNRYAYLSEKRRALEVWARELRRIISGSFEEGNVISLYR